MNKDSRYHMFFLSRVLTDMYRHVSLNIGHQPTNVRVNSVLGENFFLLPQTGKLGKVTHLPVRGPKHVI